MLEVSNVSNEVRTAFQSITFRGKSLLMTALLGLIIFYLFGAIGFVEFPDLFRFGRPDIVQGNALSPNNYAASCTTLWKCSVVVLDLGLRAKDLGAGMQELPWVDDEPDPRLFGRMIYTFMFFVIISLIVLNMILGIIIDTFAELRENSHLIEWKIGNECFICNLPRHKFEVLSAADVNGWDRHTNFEHSVQSYIYYILYLKMKNVDELTGGESFVHSRIFDVTHNGDRNVVTLKRTVDTSWIPEQQAFILTKESSVSNFKMSEALGTLEAISKKLVTTLDAKFSVLLQK